MSTDEQGQQGQDGQLRRQGGRDGTDEREVFVAGWLAAGGSNDPDVIEDEWLGFLEDRELADSLKEGK